VTRQNRTTPLERNRSQRIVEAHRAHFRSSPHNGHRKASSPSPFGANTGHAVVIVRWPRSAIASARWVKVTL